MKNLLSFLLFALFSNAAFAAYLPPGAPNNSIQINNSGIFAGITGSPTYVTNPAYGAKCNGRHQANATTTSGNGVIGGTFWTATDVGKQIAVYSGTPISTTGNTHTTLIVDGLGTTTGVHINQQVIGTGIPNETYVSAINSSTSITLTQAATATNTGISIKFVPFINDVILSVVAGTSATLTTNTSGISITGTAIVNYGTDDAAALNTAEAAAVAAGSGTLLLPDGGQCVVASPLIINNSNISVFGYSRGTSGIKWLSTHSLGIGYEGAITYNLSGTATTPIANNEAAHFYIDMDNSFTSSYQYYNKCIDGTYMVNPEFHDLYLKGSPATCLGIDYVEKGLIVDNLIENAGREQTSTTQDGDCIALEIGGGYLPNLESTIIVNNHCINFHHYGIEVESFGGQSGIQANISLNNLETNQNNAIGIEDNGATGINIIGNTLISTALNPIGSAIDNSGGPASNYNGQQGNIADNFIQGWVTGISLTAAGGTIPSFNSIRGNTIYNCGKYGINIAGFSTVNIGSINMDNNFINGCQSSGIALTANSGTPTMSNISLTNNILESNGHTASSDSRKAAIYTNVSIAGLFMNGNYAWDDGNGYEKYGFSVDTGITITNGWDTNNDYTHVSSSAENILGTFTPELQYGIGGMTSSYPATAASTTTFTNKTYDTAGTGNVFKINGKQITAVSGNTGTAATSSGTLTNGHCVSIDGNGNFVDAGGACTTGGGGGTVASSSIGQVPVYTGATTVTGAAAMTYTSGVLTLGTATTTLGSIVLSGSTSGTTTLNPNVVASGTLTLPASTDTLIGKATTDILTNKTYDTAGTGNIFKINGTSINAVTGTGSAVLSASPTLTGTAVVAAQTNSGILYLNGGTAQEAVFAIGNSGTSKAVALDSGNFQTITISGAVALTLTAPTHPDKITLVATQDATGHIYSISGCKWAGGTPFTYSTAANKIDVISIVYDGTNFYCSGAAAFN